MKINKKEIIASVILVMSIVVSGLGSYQLKATADEETLSQVKQQLQEKDRELEEKINESNDKDKEIEELNSKVSEQENTINQLNNSVQSLSTDLDDTKQVQKQDKKEVIVHSDSGDANLQKQVDTVKEEMKKPTKTDASGECSPDPEKENK